MNKLVLLTVVLGCYGMEVKAQVKIGKNKSLIDTSAYLQIESNNSKQLLVNKDSGNVGIGTLTPANAAILEVNATDMGVLIPRVSLTGKNDISTISNPANGLMVVNTTTANTGTNQVYANQIYVFNGVNWDKLITSSETYKTVNYNNQSFPTSNN